LKLKFKKKVKDRKHFDFDARISAGEELDLHQIKSLCKHNHATYIKHKIHESDLMHEVLKGLQKDYELEKNLTYDAREEIKKEIDEYEAAKNAVEDAIKNKFKAYK